MARKKVDTALLANLVKESQTQEVSSRPPLTNDPNFPVFTTPVNRNVLVYIPMTNVITDENGAVMQTLNAHFHNYKNGKTFGTLRCINGLTGEAAEALGYDGTCPVCEASKECWDLVNLKTKVKAEELGLDPDDKGDVLKGFKKAYMDERSVKNAEEYVTFPVCLIPIEDNKLKLTADAMDNIEVQYVTWSKKRYETNIIDALESLMNNPGHPAGRFWFWKFTYKVEEGKQASARDSAKNAKYEIIQDAEALALLDKFKSVCEEKAKEFTILKAAEVLVINEFWFREDIEAEVNKIMAKTRLLLNAGEGAIQTQQVSAGAGNPLLGSVDPNQTAGNSPLGVSASALGTPVKFEEAE